MGDRKFKTLKDLMASYKADKNNVKLVEPVEFKEQATASFDIYKACQDRNHPFYLIKAEIEKSASNLGLAYSISTTVYRDVKLWKESRGEEEVFGERYVIGSIDVPILKDTDKDSMIDDKMVTPTRFAMITTLAAEALYKRAKKANDLDLGKELMSLTNPFAMFHGFYPHGWKDWTDPEMNLMLCVYLCTTIGFDALVYVRPTVACAIAIYRSSGDHPRKLGLLNGLDGPSNPSRNPELAARCAQGIYTKSFMFKNASIKVEHALENSDFQRAVKGAYAVVLDHATEPVRKRAVRAANVVHRLLKLTMDLRNNKPDTDDEDNWSSTDDDTGDEGNQGGAVPKRQVQKPPHTPGSSTTNPGLQGKVSGSSGRTRKTKGAEKKTENEEDDLSQVMALQASQEKRKRMENLRSTILAMENNNVKDTKSYHDATAEYKDLVNEAKSAEQFYSKVKGFGIDGGMSDDS